VLVLVTTSHCSTSAMARLVAAELPSSVLPRWRPAMTMTMIRAWARRARSGATKRQKSPSNSNANANASSKPSAKPSDSVATETTEPTGYAAYGEFVKAELAAQDIRKASFEQRGQTVITTAGTLVTLLFALAALSTKQTTTFTLPHSARTWLLVGLALFFASAIAALVTNAPLVYQVVPVAKIQERLHRKPAPTADRAAKAIALTRLDALASAKSQNTIKGWALAIALGLEALAVGCVAIAVSRIL